MIRVTGPGWTRFRGFAERLETQVKHSEKWVQGLKRDRMDGFMVNTIMKRKNKRDFPEYDPIPIPKSS